MPGKRDSNLHSKLMKAARTAPGGPINAGAILQHKNVVFAKAANLLAYHNYLTKARSWKAAQKGVGLEFEREVQAQAGQALADVRELAAASLRVTKHMRQAGQIDRVLNDCMAGIKAAGPVQVQDLWDVVESEPKARQVLKDEGLTDELWTLIAENMKKLEGRVFIEGGKLAAEVKGPGQDRLRHVTIIPSPKGMPRTISELLKRGEFERTVEELGQTSVPSLSLDAGAGEPRELEISDVMLGWSVLSLQSVAQHKRKLEDTGLATYAGDAVGAILLIIAGGLIIASLITHAAYCGEEEHEDEVLCKINSFIMLLGFLLFIGVVLVGMALLPNTNIFFDSWMCEPDGSGGGVVCHPPPG